MTSVWKNKQFLLGLGFAVCSLSAATLYVLFAGSYSEDGGQKAPIVERLGLREPEPEKVVPEATLSLSATEKRVVPGEAWEVSADLNVSGATVTGSDVIIPYDPIYLSFKEASNADDFSRILSTESKGGLVAISAVMDPESTFSGDGKVANLYFEALRTGETEIRLITKDMAKGESSGVIESGTGNNILKPFSSSVKCSIIEQE